MTMLNDFSGDFTVIAPSGGVTVNTPVQVGGVVVLPRASADESAEVSVNLLAAHSGKMLSDAPKAASEVWAAGDALWFTTGSYTKTAVDEQPAVGIAAAPALSAATSGAVIPVGPATAVTAAA